LFGESPEQIKAWIANYSGGAAPKGFNTKLSALLWLLKPFSPRNYPRTAFDVLAFGRESSAEADDLLGRVIPVNPASLSIIVGFETERGPIFAGLDVPEPKRLDPSGGTKHRNRRHDGFRPGHVPKNVLLSRYYGDTKVSVTEVSRVDAEYCLQRGSGGYNQEVHGKRVAIVGCGSLGADVAQMLARSGVRQFSLVDDDLLSWGNVTRHVLGGGSVGRAKAAALAEELSRQMPWLDITSEGFSAEQLIYERPKVLQSCDLIISTTGHWSSDCILNAAGRTFPRFPPIIFGWTEAYGLCGHALAVLRQGGCLACGMNEFGVFGHRVTEWPVHGSTLVQATGCSDIYQPYGVADVAPIKALIVKLALEVLENKLREGALRTWVGNMESLSQVGGQLNDGWKDNIIPTMSDSRIISQEWPIYPKCPLCN